ncbi:MAG: hypothetical protein GY844_29905 [Bradyrhizobium sp.]|nr:hypothetical protein [Bradyrhizobium sp.]
MMWPRLMGSVVILAGGVISARSADESLAGMESCFRAARVADAICSKLVDDPAQRLDCFRKTRADQLTCLEQVLQAPAKAATPEAPSDASRAEKPAKAPSSRESSEQAAPTGQAGSHEVPAEKPSPEKSNSQLTDTGTAAEPPRSSEPTGGIGADLGPKTADVPKGPIDPNWVVSETTSPVDYTPVVTAQIRSTSQGVAVPGTLVVRCRGQRTELAVRTDGTWIPTRGSDLRVEYQIDDQPAVGLQWVLSSDGKTATYKDDPVALLQSLGDGARLKINVVDRARPSNEATFQIGKWSIIREKIVAACKWGRTAGKR